MKIQLQFVPSSRQIIGAIHQSEGILLSGVDGSDFSFVPDKVNRSGTVVTGTCYTVENNQFGKEFSASLKIQEDENNAKLGFLVY